MDKVLAVAIREFVATVRTKAFVLSILAMPIIIVASIFGTQWAMERSKNEAEPLRKIALIDQTGMLGAPLNAEIARWNEERPKQLMELEPLPPETDPAELRERIARGDLYAYLLMRPDAVTADAGGDLARKDDNLEMGRKLQDMIYDAVVSVRVRNAGFDPAVMAKLRRYVPITAVDASTGHRRAGDEVARILTPFAFMFLLFMGTFGIAQGLLTSVIEEKSSRIIEVLLSAVSPMQIMAGKIVGMVCVGLLLMTVWGGGAYFAAQQKHMTDLVTGYRLVLALAYFLPGFLLMAAILAAIGSACNELKDAQSMVFPITLLTIIPMVFWMYISEHPTSALSVVLSYVPIITPFVMILRICADSGTPIWQIASSMALLWGTVVLAFWAAAKVFRVGVLMYGKPPSLRELLRWVRYT